MNYPENDYRAYLEHSYKGTTWKKENPKYSKKINGRYYYSEDVGADEVSARFKDLKKKYSSDTVDEATSSITEKTKNRIENRKGIRAATNSAKIKAAYDKAQENRRNAEIELYKKREAKKKEIEERKKKLKAANNKSSDLKRNASLNKKRAEDELEKRKSNKVEYAMTAAKSKAKYTGRKAKAKVKKIANALSKLID